MPTQTEKAPKQVSEAVDHFTGAAIKWPPLVVESAKYDFVFRQKDGCWRYMNSANTLLEFNGCKKAAVMGGGYYAILEHKTGNVVESNDPQFK